MRLRELRSSAQNALLGRMTHLGASILRSVGRKCQTAEVGFAEGECSDQPAAFVGPQSGELKEQLGGSFGKGSAARHGAQGQRRIRLRPRAQTQAAARAADVDGGTKFDEKLAARGEAAHREGERCTGSRFAAGGAEPPCASNLTRPLRHHAGRPRWTNHLASCPSGYLIGKYCNAKWVPQLHENCATVMSLAPKALAQRGS